jgi:PAS domain S-box-containing protein
MVVNYWTMIRACADHCFCFFDKMYDRNKFVTYEIPGQLSRDLKMTIFTTLKIPKFALTFNLLLILIALATFLGWSFNVVWLRRPLEGFVSMNPLTAVLFLFCALAYYSKTFGSGSRFSGLGNILGFLVTVSGLLILSGRIFHFDPVLDRLFFSGDLNNDLVGRPNRMAPNTAACFILSGVSLLCVHSETKSGRMPAQILAMVLAFIGMLSILGYIYQVKAFYGMSGYIPMALQTAVCFLLFAFSILFTYPAKGLMKAFTSRGSGGMMARSLIPAALFIPSILGLVRLTGEWNNLFSSEFGTSLLIASIITVFMFIIHQNAVIINLRDEQRDAAESKLAELNRDLEDQVAERTAALSKSERLYHTIASNIPKSAITVVDKEERYLLVEGSVMDQLGYNRPSLIGKRVRDTTPAERYALVADLYERVLKGEAVSREIRTLHMDLFLQFVPIFNEYNVVEMAMVVALDITEIKQAQRTIQQMNEALEQKVEERTEQLTTVNKELESFSYSVSHDLRAPLRAIDGYSKILEEEYGKLLDEEGKRILGTVQYNAQKMGQLIDDLLAFSRLGKKDVQTTKLDMRELIEGSIVELKRNINFQAEIVIGETLPVDGDYSMISQVVINLVSNAVKYSAPKAHPKVEIGSFVKNGHIAYFFRDNGVGFNMQYVHKLFGVFQRLHKMEDFEGTGVGLAIVQRIISKHGGSVWAEGKIDEGATFYFSLPRKS